MALAVPVVLESTGSVVAGGLAVIVAVAAPRVALWLVSWGQFWLRKPHRRRRAALWLGVIVLMFGVTRVAHLDLRLTATEMVIGEEAETIYLPPTPMLKVLALGHQSFLSDLLFIRAAHYFHDHLDGDRIFTWLEAYVSAVKDLDPYNRRLYSWAAQMVKLGQRITNDVLERSNQYARDGLKYFPDYWRLYWDIGFNYFHDWTTTSAEEKRRMRAKALPYIALAAALPESELDANFVAGLYERNNDEQMAVFHLYLRYWESAPEQRQIIRGNLIRHGSRASAEQLKNLEESWKRDKPYVAIELYELLGSDQRRGELPVAKGWARVGLREVAR